MKKIVKKKKKTSKETKKTKRERERDLMQDGIGEHFMGVGGGVCVESMCEWIG